jgi:hypothetical protein
MKKQTAVEWLVDQIKSEQNQRALSANEWVKVIEQAKAMECEQIIETWHNGYENQSPMIDEENCGQQYYNETYK